MGVWVLSQPVFSYILGVGLIAWNHEAYLAFVSLALKAIFLCFGATYQSPFCLLCFLTQCLPPKLTAVPSTASSPFQLTHLSSPWDQDSLDQDELDYHIHPSLLSVMERDSVKAQLAIFHSINTVVALTFHAVCLQHTSKILPHQPM